MDTQTTAKRNVDAEIAVIKSKMPGVYQSIKDQAAKGQGVFEVVRRGLRGEPNCFYAIEGGHVMGTPFKDTTIMDDMAALMVRYGKASVCIFAPSVYQGSANGTN